MGFSQPAFGSSSTVWFADLSPLNFQLRDSGEAKKKPDVETSGLSGRP
jgi:hypothetical protein